jgi:methionyl aminopeptidase
MDEVDLIATCELAMWSGIATARPDGRLGDLSWAIQNSVDQSARQDGRRYGSVVGYGGHGIGTAMHMAPFVPNQGKRGKGLRLIPGMALAVEPMITLGRPATRELADGWTVVTKDGSRAAHVEHSIAITDDGVSVLTAADAGVAGLARFGVVPVSLD